MFSEKEKESYQKIKAPETLREKILTSEKPDGKTKPFFARNFATLAACLIIAICIIPQLDIIKKEENTVVPKQNDITDNEERIIADASFNEPYVPEKEIAVDDNKTVSPHSETANQPAMARVLPEPAEETPAVTEKFSLPVNLNCGENSKVSVSEGVLHLHLPEEGTKISGSEISATGDIWLVWEIENPDINKTYELKMITEETEKNYILQYESVWSLKKVTE